MEEVWWGMIDFLVSSKNLTNNIIAISRPVPYQCEITPRSDEARRLVLATDVVWLSSFVYLYSRRVIIMDSPICYLSLSPVRQTCKLESWLGHQKCFELDKYVFLVHGSPIAREMTQ